ncbi:MAG: hypothetical protein HY868_12265 [Chloroflexi bacterium]|nr:hypothetical protein [Chloroflexota bacterium]
MEKRVESVSELAVQVARDPELAKRIQANPAETLAGLAAPLQSDVWIYRVVVGTLGLGVLVGMVGAIVLALVGKPIPEVLIALGSAAIGALAGLLAPSPANK